MFDLQFQSQQIAQSLSGQILFEIGGKRCSMKSNASAKIDSTWRERPKFTLPAHMLTCHITCVASLRVYMRKLAPARVSHWDDFLISYRVYMMTGSFHILLFNGTFHVDKIHVWFKIANITHALPVPVYRQTDFTPKWVVVSRLHDTVARFRTGVKFSPRCENRGELTPG